jgi:hypothetical protein
MTFIKCPHCNKGFEHIVEPRVCADCGKGIGRHGKYRWVKRNGMATIVHKDCLVPNGGPGFNERKEL